MWPSTRRQLVIAVVAMLVMALAAALSPVSAQDAKGPVKDDELGKLDFWRLNAGLEVQAAMHVIGAGNGKGTLVARILASEEPSPLMLLDTEVGKVKWRFDFDEPLPLPERWLSVIRDRKPIPVRQANELKGADLAWVSRLQQGTRIFPPRQHGPRQVSRKARRRTSACCSLTSWHSPKSIAARSSRLAVSSWESARRPRRASSAPI